MKKDIIESIISAYRDGTLSKAMLKFKKDIETKLGSTLNATEFATYLYDNEINKNREAVAGEQELANAFAYFSQEAQGGEEDSDDDPFWLNVWDADTKLNYGGKPVELNELAHLLNLDLWKKDIPGHLKHNPDTNMKLNNTDAKFDFENGKLHLYMNPEDKGIHKGLREGIIKPSIEVGFPEYMYDSTNNKIKSYVKVRGLGLMEDGKQMGLNVGPRVPNKTAIGGKNMADGNDGDTPPTESDKFQTELKVQMEKSPKTVVEKKDDYLKKIDEFKIEGEFKIAFDLFLEKNKPVEPKPNLTDKEAHKAELKAQSDKHKTEMEELKKLLEDNQQKSKVKDESLAKLEKGLIDVELANAKRDGIANKDILIKENMSLDEIKFRIADVARMRDAFLKGTPEEDIEPFIVQKKEGIKDSKGNLTDKGYNALNDALVPNKSNRFSKPLPGYDPTKK